MSIFSECPEDISVLQKKVLSLSISGGRLGCSQHSENMEFEIPAIDMGAYCGHEFLHPQPYMAPTAHRIHALDD